jgi:hypothetical protein
LPHLSFTQGDKRLIQTMVDEVPTTPDEKAQWQTVTTYLKEARTNGGNPVQSGSSEDVDTLTATAEEATGTVPHQLPKLVLSASDVARIKTEVQRITEK